MTLHLPHWDKTSCCWKSLKVLNDFDLARSAQIQPLSRGSWSAIDELIFFLWLQPRQKRESQPSCVVLLSLFPATCREQKQRAKMKDSLACSQNGILFNGYLLAEIERKKWGWAICSILLRQHRKSAADLGPSVHTQTLGTQSTEPLWLIKPYAVECSFEAGLFNAKCHKHEIIPRCTHKK